MISRQAPVSVLCWAFGEVFLSARYHSAEPAQRTRSLSQLEFPWFPCFTSC